MYVPSIRDEIYGDLAKLIIESGAKKATKFLSRKLTVKATRRLFNGKVDGRSKRIEILFTIGTPNFRERKFIKLADKANEPFPVKNILIKWIKD